jgi:DNA polymerase-3 subunit epsilon
MRDFAALDFETANYNRSSICSIGLVIVRGGVIVDKVYRLVCPTPNWYLWRFSEIHGLEYDDTCEASNFAEVWSELSPLLAGLPLVAHNSSFDEGCLRAAHAAYEMPYPNEYKFHCTYRASRRLYKDLPNHQLHTVSAYCGYDLSDHHHALSDAEACAAIALRVFNQSTT